MAGLLRRILTQAGLRPAKPELVFADLTKLYQDTLLHSQPIRPWAFRDGTYVALELRYGFAKAYLNGGIDFDAGRTPYCQFLDTCEREGFKGLYDGNRRYALADAEATCRRYAALLDSLKRNMGTYNRLNGQNLIPALEGLGHDIAAFERQHPQKVFYFREQRYGWQKERNRYAEPRPETPTPPYLAHVVGHLVLSTVRIGGRLVVRNGSHRLAAFRALREGGWYARDTFPVYITS